MEVCTVLNHISHALPLNFIMHFLWFLIMSDDVLPLAKVKKTTVDKRKLPDFGAVLVDESMIEFNPFLKGKPDCGPLNMKLET